jgi:chromosome segregation ATPase
MTEEEIAVLTNRLREIASDFRERAPEIDEPDGAIVLADAERFVAAASLIESLRASLAQLEERNAELEEAVDKLQDGIRFIQLHQSKRRK